MRSTIFVLVFSPLLMDPFMKTTPLSIAAEVGQPRPITYTLRFPSPQSHYVEVEAVVPTEGRGSIELMMPVWTPGSYLIREYARHVEDLKAFGMDGEALRARKSSKNRWRIETGGLLSEIRVAYRVYCREMAVQTNWVDDAFAMLNGAPTFLTLVESGPRRHVVRLELPRDWSISETGLAVSDDGEPHSYVASDYDELVDCPIYAGNGEVFSFEVEGKPHILLVEGGGGVWDGPRSAADLKLIVEEQARFWGGLPYDRYVFFNILSETGGGLEHRNSTVLMASRWATRTRPAYLGWLFLASHEFFHTWNVKRLRPVELGPFDYEREVHTRSLWVAEGLTSYYDRLMVRRAGLCSLEEFLAGDPPRRGQSRAEHEIEQVQTTPGRQVQALEDSSFDAWIKFYRRDENTANTSISYYTKGAVVGFLIDAHIRRLTAGQKSLDDVMRRAYELYSGERGYTPEEFRAVASEVAGTDLSAWFHRALESTVELDYSEALGWYGLRFAPAKSGEAKPAAPKAWLGLETRNQGGLLVVEHVRRGTPGFDAGFNVGDEIVAIGDDRILADQWASRLESYRPGEAISVLVSRRGRLRRLQAVLGEEPTREWTLQVVPEPTQEQRNHLKEWLHLTDPVEGPG